MSKKAQTQTGARAIRAIFADAAMRAEEQTGEQAPDPNLPRQDAEGNPMKPGQWPGHPHDRMPPGCPIRVVGRSSDGIVYCITTSGHFRAVEKWDMPTLTDLFAPRVNDMMWAWPAFGKKKVPDPDDPESQKEIMVVKRVERDQVMTAIIQEAARKPDFDPNTQHRGRGGWEDSDGRFVWHSGGWLWSADGKKLQKARPAEHKGFLYTRQAATIEPWQEPVSVEESPARRILEDLKTWNWQRPYLDPLLVLGWLATALMGGALKARPILFTTGGHGVGKSTLLELLRGVLEGAVISTVNTTAAGIYQRAKQDSLPFLVDELESKSGSTRADNVIELARVAYTGGDISRGGADHEATTFTARNSFGFFAINAPPMGAQDKSRMAMLNLARLDKANGLGRKVSIFADTDGRMMLRQMMDGWGDFKGRIMPNYWEALAQHGLDSRAIDTYGTLLAACELLVGHEPMDDCGLPVFEFNRIGEIVAAATSIERTENLDNWHKCLDHLMQSTINKWSNGEKPTVGGVCENLRIGEWDAKNCSDRLQLVNLGCKAKGKVPGSEGPCLAIPADGPALTRIFAETEFHKGVWYGALKQAPPGIVLRDKGNHQKLKINGSTKHCLLVDLEAFDRFTAKME